MLGILSEGDALDPDTVHRLTLFKDRAFYGSADLISRSAAAEKYAIGSIFADSTESFVLKKVFGQDFSQDKFSFDMPFLASRNLAGVLRLRDKYQEQFIQFRKLFSDLELDQSESDVKISEKIESEILPHFFQLERLIESEREGALAAIFDNGGVATAAIVGSVLTSGVSGLVASAAAILGGGHFAHSVVPNIRKLLTEPAAAKDSKMYFGWKVKQVTQ